MPLGSLDRTPPPFFRQGASALSRLIFFSALALFLMVADTRFRLTGPVRMAIATVLYPVQWAVLQPVQWARAGVGHVQSLRSAQEDAELFHEQLRLQAPRWWSCWAGRCKSATRKKSNNKHCLRDKPLMSCLSSEV